MNPAADVYREAFARLCSTLPGSQLPWLLRLREAALASFVEAGFPTLRHEDWKYTSVAAIENADFQFEPDEVAIQPELIEAWNLPDTHRLVFVNGRYRPAASQIGPLPAGVMLASLANVLTQAPDAVQAMLGRSPEISGFSALNAAFMADGAVIRLGAGVVLDQPVHLLFIGTGSGLAVHTRNVVIAGLDSRVSVIEQHVTLNEGAGFTNTLTDLVAERGAEIEHHKLQQESLKAFHVAALNADLQQDSRFISRVFALGGALARTDIRVGLNAERTGCVLDGLYVTDGRQHVDHHTRIDHARPHGTSRELYKGVLAGASRAVFNGRVIVHPDAQHSDAYQANRNLLLSDNAEIDTKPQLEIFADDVKCSHGATVGQIDPAQVFYLRSRGLDAAAAQAVLIHAFAAEMVERVAFLPLRERLDSLLRQRLPGQGRDMP